MSNAIDLLACPFCGSTDLSVVSNGYESMFVECNSCGTSGPVAPDEQQSVNAWNRRVTQ